VISVEDWVTIRNLKSRNPALGTRAIAGLLGISRNTVKDALASDRPPKYERPKVLNPDIAPWVEYVTESYLVKRLRVSRIMGDLRSKGYTGSRTALYRWIEEELKPRREAQNAQAFKPYETKPGEQMQYDWAEYRVLIGESITRVFVHLSILGYSRYKAFDASLSVHQGDVFAAIEEALVAFGGLTERVQVDCAKVFVLNASSATFRWNPKFLQFCGFFGLEPTRSAPYHPWSKGKVEKPFDHLETHFIQGARFDSFEQFLSKLKAYQDEVNATEHSVTRKKPAELFELEQKVLRPLPCDSLTGEPKRFVGVAEHLRTVSSDCLVCWGGNRYSVPHVLVRSQLWVRVRKGTSLEIYSQNGTLVASHRLCTGKGHVVVEPAHYRGYRKQSDVEGFEMSAHRLRTRLDGRYPRLDEFFASLRAQKRFNPEHHLSRIMQIFAHYRDESCINAMDACFRYRCFSASFIQGIIGPEAAEPLSTIPIVEIPRLRLSTPPIKRDLKEYQL
jgi:transposase